MGLFEEAFARYLAELRQVGTRLRFLGRMDRFPANVQAVARQAEAETAGGTAGTLALAFGYGGQQEIADAAAQLVRDGVPADEVTPQALRQRLYGAELPEVDLVIRTSGEQRTSGFMLWRAAYAELHFTPKYWPAFEPADFDAALADYAQRQRRFGK
jgi:undecaprenyl diphosphate synthase